MPKKPPNSPEAELAVLGSMLNSINSLNAGLDEVDSSDFYFANHSVIFQGMKNLRSRNIQVDTLTLNEELTRTKEIEKIGGVGFLMEISNYAEPFYNMEGYIKIVKNKSLSRKIMSISQEAQKLAFDDPEDPVTVLDNIQKMFHEASLTGMSEGFKHVREIINGEKAPTKLSFSDLITDYQEKLSAGIDPTQLAGIPSGYIDLDKIIGGFGNSNLIILAARPGMGKTTLALNFLLNASVLHKTPVAVFSLEMGSDQLLWKLCGIQGEINADSAKKKILTPLEFQLLVGAAGILSQQDIFLEDPPKITIAQLKSRARRLKECHNIGMLIIDYLQLITSSAKSPNRQEEVAGISRELKSLARELNIPIICLAQLSRKVEERDSKRPVMSDLRESGAIEQDADVILFINRRDYHDPIDKPGLAEIIVGKNRHGETGNATLSFQKNTGKFQNCTFKLPAEDDEYEKQFDEKLKRGSNEYR